jgi:hypothetical protein
VSDIEFGVEEATVGDDQLFVTGRCYQGPIHVGDLFVVARQQQTTEVSEGSDARAVRLTIKAIAAYGRSLEILDSGLTARLELAGAGATAVRHRDILSGPPGQAGRP